MEKYDDNQGECSSQGSSDQRLSELYEWRTKIYQVDTQIGTIIAQVQNELRSTAMNMQSNILVYTAICK